MLIAFDTHIATVLSLVLIKMTTNFNLIPKHGSIKHTLKNFSNFVNVTETHYENQISLTSKTILDLQIDLNVLKSLCLIRSWSITGMC